MTDALSKAGTRLAIARWNGERTNTEAHIKAARENGKLGGRRGIETPCPKCGATCGSRKAAKVHCRNR